MNFEWLSKFGGTILSGLTTTLWLTVLSGAIGFVLAVLVGLAGVSHRRWLSALSATFVSIIRGTPLLVQIFLIYTGLGALFASIPGFTSTYIFKQFLRDGFPYLVLALTLSTGGYVGELVRVALLSVPRGEIEAAQVYGFRGINLVRRIWLPRALQSILPALAGESVLLMKATALASAVAVLDLLGAANKVRSATLLTYEPLIVVAVVYFLCTLVIEALFRRIERHYARMQRPA